MDEFIIEEKIKKAAEKVLAEMTEKIFAVGYQSGIIELANKLGLIEEEISERQAYKTYGERQVKEWRSKRWIVGYPTGNKKIKKLKFRRSELETASRMLDMQNIIPPTRMKQILEQTGKH